MDAFKPIIAKAAGGSPLSREEAEAAFDRMLAGDLTAAQSAGYLMALRVREESVAEIEGAVRAMRSKMLRVRAPADAVDIVGTGGDQSGSYNVSTLAALVTAACGVPVAKHGNRAASSRSGAADVLAALGVRVGLDPPGVERCLDEAGIAFMFAPSHHASMRHVAPVRGELGTRTIFNLLGPLSNPAGVRRQLVGVFDEAWLEPLARVLANLGSQAVWLVHGSDGLDEVTTTGPTRAVILEDGVIRHATITPEEAGLPRAMPEALKGGEAGVNAAALTAVLDGARSAYRDIAVLNAAVALIVAGRVADVASGAAMADAAVESGAARDVLARLVRASNAPAPEEAR